MKQAITLFVLVTLPAFAHAQDAPEWRVTAHGLWVQAGAPPAGNGHLDASAPLIQIPLGFGPAQTSLVSSWFFGAGPALVAATDPQKRFPWGSLVPLDSALTSAESGPQSGPGVGVSLTRRLRGRASAEVSVDVSRSGTGFSRSARATIASARTTYETFFQGMTEVFDGNTGRAKVTATGIESRPSELQATAALRFDLRTRRRFPFHLTAGGGIVRRAGADTRVTLINEYAFNTVNFRSGLINPFSEVDRVVLHARGARRRGVITVGGGTSRKLSSRLGVEVDVRTAISRPSVTVTVDAAPHVTLVSDPDLVRSGIHSIAGVPVFPAPPIAPTVMVFDSSAEFSSTYPSSLSGPSLTGLQTFSGHGVEVNTTIRAGLYYRF